MSELFFRVVWTNVVPPISRDPVTYDVRRNVLMGWNRDRPIFEESVEKVVV